MNRDIERRLELDTPAIAAGLPNVLSPAAAPDIRSRRERQRKKRNRRNQTAKASRKKNRRP